MKKNVLLLVLLLSSSFLVFAQTGEDDNPANVNNQEKVTVNGGMNPNHMDMESENEITYLRNQNILLYSQVIELNSRVSRLESENAELRRILVQQGYFSNTAPIFEQSKQNGIISIIKFVLIAITFVVVISLIFCIIHYLKKQRKKNYKHQVYNKEKPANSVQKSARDSINSDRYSGSLPSRHPLNTRPSSDFPAWRKPEETRPNPSVFVDEISPLYNSKEKRDKRLDSNTDDIFLDVSRSIIERLTMGEKVRPILEERGSYATAMFILVKDRNLYINFYNYNETNKLIREKEEIISMIYDKREGSLPLPGFVKSCIPAIIKQSDDHYEIRDKGKLEIR